MFLSIVAFIIILGLLIFVHELGHFLTARVFGVKAEEFGFGFPPRMIGVVFNEKKQKWEIIKGNKEVKRKNTIYSLNYIPIGGFVKILGEDGEDKGQNKKDKKIKVDKKSNNFSHKPVWQRIIILSAGVIMNFITAAIILSFGFMIGLPEPVEDEAGQLKNPKVQIIEVIKDSPAQKMGLASGDEILKIKVPETGQSIEVEKTAQVVSFIKKNSNREILIKVKRGDDIYRLKGTPRENPPEGQGSLGIALSRVAIVSYPFFESIKMGFSSTIGITKQMLIAFKTMFGDFIFKGDSEKLKQVSGPLGIVVLTNQMTEMGFSYLVQFAALLSINLAIINILPIPALDGGRILFLLLESIKGKPVSSRLEGKFHLIGMFLLLTLMFVITVRDFFKFEEKFEVLFEKISNIL
ncbi:MAG: RIP metalloprotease RseP [Candidatus Moranbacteria bacterium]|nr:RIP metalloprotease RseP [Candidatus Moranbacteria bacterium]